VIGTCFLFSFPFMTTALSFRSTGVKTFSIPNRSSLTPGLSPGSKCKTCNINFPNLESSHIPRVSGNLIVFFPSAKSFTAYVFWKGGRLNRSSYKIHPKAHISALLLYRLVLVKNSNSGARYPGVPRPQCEMYILSDDPSVVNPKSAIFQALSLQE
jgi:hypothetical protein